MWPRTDLTALLAIENPIIQAPIASATTPTLAAAVANAGGLGSLGCAFLAPSALKAEIEATRALTHRPFNANFFVHPSAPMDPALATRARRRLSPYYAELGLGEVPEPVDPVPRFDRDQLPIVLELRLPVVSFHFGLPSEHALKAIKATGARILASATTLDEARWLEAAGVDAIIAQGSEAGGHRGTFHGSWADGLIGTMALVPQIVDAVRIPVIAAGGIADGRGIAAAFALGASGVQMGTAFLGCPEASVDPVYRAALREAGTRTTLTRAFSGRPARGIRNRFVDEMATTENDIAPFAAQISLTAPLRRASAERRLRDFQSMWAGQAAPLTRALPAGALVKALVGEAHAALRS